MKKSDIKILCVDDEPDILEILKYNLSNVGYDICLLYTSPSPRD